MIDLNVYAELLKSCVVSESVKDANWNWITKNITQTTAHIGWGYLDYLGVKNGFTIVSSEDETIGDVLTAKDLNDDNDNFIDFIVVGGKFKDTESSDKGIKRIVQAIACYAHSRY